MALAANEMETSLFVPIALKIREGTVRTEVIQDRDVALAAIEGARAAAKLITRHPRRSLRQLLMLGRLSWARLRWWIAARYCSCGRDLFRL